MLVEFTNDYHNTAASVRISKWGDRITRSQCDRLFRSLCGIKDCCCGGLRGHQPETDGHQHDLFVDDYEDQGGALGYRHPTDLVATVDAYSGCLSNTWLSDSGERS